MDITEKVMLAHNEIFADVFNVLLFGGQQIICPDDLEDASSFSQFAKDGIIASQNRDVAKYYRKNGDIVAYLGIENQTAYDRFMPMRMMNYDSAVYKSQIDDYYDVPPDKRQEIYPPVSLVLHYDTKRPWTKNTDIHSILNISDDWKDFIMNNEINVRSIAFLDDETIDMFKSDYKDIAHYFRCQRLGEEFHRKVDKLRYSRAFFMMMSQITGDERFIDNYYKLEEQGQEVKNMDEYLSKVINRGITQGRAEGRSTGIIGVIRNMLNSKMEKSLISKMTGFNDNDIDSILDMITSDPDITDEVIFLNLNQPA